MKLDLPDEDVLLVLMALRRASQGKRLIGQQQQFACADLADRVARLVQVAAGERPAVDPVRWPSQKDLWSKLPRAKRSNWWSRLVGEE